MPSLRNKISEVFELDLRSLAGLRIAVGLLVLIDLVWRAQDLVAHYTDVGVLPRSVYFTLPENRWFWSLHLVNGTWQAQALLFGVAAVFAVALIAGYRTRPVTIISWLLLISLQSRNPVIGEAGDVLLRMLLFWGMFLPWGICWSVDRARHPNQEALPNRCLNWATVAYVIQILVVYWFSVLLKSGPQWRSELTAVYFTLSIDQMTTEFGRYWLQYPRLLEVITASVFWFEMLGPGLLISPIYTNQLRLVSFVGFLLMHVSFFVCLDLGLFPWIGLVSLMGFLPSSICDKISCHLRRPAGMGLKIYYDAECHFCSTGVRLLKGVLLLPHSQLLPAQSDPSLAADMRTHNSWIVVTEDGTRHFSFDAGTVLVGGSKVFGFLHPLLTTTSIKRLGATLYRLLAQHRCGSCEVAVAGPNQIDQTRLGPVTNFLVPMFLLYILLWNIATIPGSSIRLSERFQAIGLMLRVDQAWNMFAPFPATDDGWYVVEAHLNNNETVDLFNNSSFVSWNKPASVLNTFQNYRWRKYMENVYESYYNNQREDYAAYLCRGWNAHRPSSTRVKELSIFYVRERTLPNYQRPDQEKLFLLTHKCLQR